MLNGRHNHDLYVQFFFFIFFYLSYVNKIKNNKIKIYDEVLVFFSFFYVVTFWIITFF